MKRLALALAMILVPAIAQADCIASSANLLAVAQMGDVITTNGPVTRVFPGGFLTQNNIAGCGQPGAAPCQYVEGDPIASRSGCVKSFATDIACASAINVAVREGEWALTRHNDAGKKNFCFLNYIATAFYAIIVWPNNLRAVNAIHQNGAFVKNPSLAANFRFRI